MEDKKKVLLSVKDLRVQFRVRGRLLTAIRGISLDIYENESIAIVGESGSGKSVFTKTFAGMLDSNGFVSKGTILFDDPELTDFHVPLTDGVKTSITNLQQKLNEASKLEFGAAIWKQILELESKERERNLLSGEKAKELDEKLLDLRVAHSKLYNAKQTYDPSSEKDKIREAAKALKDIDKEIKELERERKVAEKQVKAAAKADTTAINEYKTRHAELTAIHNKEIQRNITPATEARNLIIAKEIVLSVNRYGAARRSKLTSDLVKALTEAMRIGVDLSDSQERSKVFDAVTFRVEYLDETEEELHGHCVLNLANVHYADDWNKIRGDKIATVFQDPMTSLNPIITIGKQISSVIIKHQGVSESEARVRAIELMDKVGIPNPTARYDDYPFQYSGGMRQRIVIAIALSCQPKLLICDEPTTALDVTIQAQILELIKDLQKDFGYTIVFITHDLGVVANIADRVAVLYAGQIVEVGTVEDVFYDPRHPYTWALLSSLPQLAERNTKLFSIMGTPPSLYNDIKGDAFAPRNPYCMKIDTMAEPPMFQVSETHFAKTWLLHPDAPKIEKPEAIDDIHGKLMKAFNI